LNVPVEANYDLQRDVRSYRISGDKLKSSIKWSPEIGVKETVEEIKSWIINNNPNFDDPIYNNMRWIKNCEKVCGCLGIKYEIDK
jgi:dTDP-D-glucose 4,6-dehydratase